MASIRDVAKKAGVGVKIVSCAFNGTGCVAEDTKVKILAMATELDYQPNELARNLFRNRTGIIGIVVPDVGNLSFSKLLKYMRIQLYKNSYKAITCNTIEISNREQDFINMLRRDVVDDIITGAHSLQDYAYLNLNKPVVAMDRNLGPDIPIVHSDRKARGRMAARPLLDAGCGNVLNFGGPSHIHTPPNDRHQEFNRVVEENGASVKTIKMVWNMMEYDYYYCIMEQHMDIYRDIDRVFTTDIGALYCLNIADQRGVKVPEKLHVVGYDTVDTTRLFTSKLTGIVQGIPGLATACVDTMMDLLDSKEVKMGQILPVSIQRGETI